MAEPCGWQGTLLVKTAVSVQSPGGDFMLGSILERQLRTLPVPLLQDWKRNSPSLFACDFSPLYPPPCLPAVSGL